MKSTNNVLTLSDQELASFSAQIEHIATILGEGFEPLDAKQTRRMPKLYARRSTAAADIVKLAGTYGISAPGASIADVKANLAAVERLGPLVARVAGLHKVLTDIVLTAQSGAWTGASTVYGVLQGNAKSNPVLKLALSPVRDQLSHRRKAAAEQDSQTANATGTAGTTSATQSVATAASKSPT
jgi:hypothetical protein